MRALAAHLERAAVGLLGAAVDRVVGRRAAAGHTRRRVARAQGDALRGGHPTGAAGRLQAGRRGRRRRAVDVHVAGVLRLDVADRVDRPVLDGVRALAAHLEGAAVGLHVAAVDRVVGRRAAAGHARAAVARREADRLGAAYPAARTGRLQAGRRGRRCRAVDVHVAGVVRGVVRLDVAGHVDRPVGHRVRAVAGHEERTGVELSRAAVDRVPSRREARAAGVRRAQLDGDAGRRPAARLGRLQVRRRGLRRGQVEVHVAGLVQAVDPDVVGRPEDDGVAALRAHRERGGVARGLLRRRAVDAVGDRDRGVVAGAGDRHRGGGVLPARAAIGGEAGGLGVRVGDVDPAGVHGLDVAGRVGGPVGHGVLPLAGDGEGRRVGLGAAAVDRVGDARHA